MKNPYHKNCDNVVWWIKEKNIFFNNQIYIWIVYDTGVNSRFERKFFDSNDGIRYYFFIPNIKINLIDDLFDHR